MCFEFGFTVRSNYMTVTTYLLPFWELRSGKTLRNGSLLRLTEMEGPISN